ncbi:MAG: DegT/DnrJ/EryC1/StrS family aminotransferase [Planctomycetia bacterium]|nr:DegT/DnrJ/EryC1/StrS family aminotransferase [Planctomycetia bacterium]
MSQPTSAPATLPAILGGAPLFPELVPIVRPALPSFAELAPDFEDMFQTRMLTRGKYLRAFEEAVAKHLGCKHALAVSSGSSALMLSYQGLGLKGDVIVPSFTFMATVNALIWNNCRPVFVDVLPDTQCIDPEAVEAAITPATTGIVAVHNFGNPVDCDRLEAVAKRHNLKVVYDAAHGFGSLYQGKPVGGQGDAQCFSLSPTKLLIAGEGGIVTTNHDDLAEHVRVGREYGMVPVYDTRFPGLNARMSEMHALVGLRSLTLLEEGVQRRQELVALFKRELATVPGLGYQTILPGDRCSYKDFSITVNPQEFGLTAPQLAKALKHDNVDNRQYWVPPVHQQSAYRRFAPSAETLHNTNWLADVSLSLPIWSRMDDDVVIGICRAIQQIHEHAAAVGRALVE